MANAPVIQTAQQFWGIKRETTVGTYAAPVAAQDFLFCEQGQVEDMVEDVLDNSWQASFAWDQGYYQGIQSAKVTLKGIVSQAATVHLARAALGQLTESGAGDPYTHTALLRTAQGPSYSIVSFDGTQANVRAVENARLQTLKFSYTNVKGFLVFEAVFLGRWVDVTQVKMTPTFDAQPHYVAWQGALTYNSVANGKLTSLTWSLTNEVEVVPGSTGSQAINDVSQNRCRIEVDSIFTPIDATEYNLYRAGTQAPFSMLFTNAPSTHTLTLQTSKLALTNGSKVIVTGKQVTAQLKGKAIANATDSGPGQIIVKNNIATGQY